MKYFIGINQKLWQEKYPKADFVMAAILDVIRSLCSSARTKKLIVDNKQYTWVNYNTIMDELPMAGIKSKGAISRRIELLKKWGLISTFKAPENSLYVLLNLADLELEYDRPVVLSEQGGGGGVAGGERVVAPGEQHNQTTNQTTNTNTASGLAVNEIIDLFKEVNPTHYKIFANKTQRAAVERLAKSMGEGRLRDIIAFLATNNSRKFAPTITTPLQLENRMGEMMAFWKKEKQSNKNTIGIAL